MRRHTRPIEDPYGNIPALGAYTFAPVSGSVTFKGIIFTEDGLQVNQIGSAATPTDTPYTLVLSAASSFRAMMEVAYPGTWNESMTGFVGTISGPVYQGVGAVMDVRDGETDYGPLKPGYTPQAGYPVIPAGPIILGRVPDWYQRAVALALADIDIDTTTGDTLLQSVLDAIDNLTNTVAFQGLSLQTQFETLQELQDVLESALAYQKLLAPNCLIDRQLSVLSTIAGTGKIKEGPGRLYGFFLTNLSGARRYVRYFDKDPQAIVAGSANSVPWFGPISLDPGEKFPLWIPPGLPFNLGLGITASTSFADTDSGAPSANDVIALTYYV